MTGPTLNLAAFARMDRERQRAALQNIDNWPQLVRRLRDAGMHHAAETVEDEMRDADEVKLNAKLTEALTDAFPAPTEYMAEGPSAPPAEGRKDDDDKERMDLLPPEPLFAIAEVLTFGANKYDARNWEGGMRWGRVFAALMRHLWAWWGGRGPTPKSFLFGDNDEETSHSHLWHAGCCLFFLITYEERGIGTDDRATGRVSA